MKLRHSYKTFFFLLLGLTVVFSACTPEPDLYFSEEITIAYAEPLSSYSPLSYEAKDRKYLANIYEPLVSFDKSFNTKTALAIGWGRLDDNTWDFRLRKGVVFHDGSNFDADDVIYSLNLARQDEVSDLGSLLSSIVRVEKTGLHRVEIETSTPDPLLLNKLTNVYISPEDYSHFDLPVGSGAYKFASTKGPVLTLNRFDSYWGSAPFFPVVNLLFEPDPIKRVQALSSGEIDVLANVPPQFVGDLKAANFHVHSFPSLELSFLMMNSELLLGNDDLRDLLWAALRNNYAQLLGGGYLLPSGQFAASGILGYLPSFEGRKQDLKLAAELSADFEGLELDLDVPVGLEIFAKLVKEDLKPFGVNINVVSHPIGEFEDIALSGQSELYFFGWKYDLGDVADFYESVVHTSDGKYGAFNGINYSNSSLDALIEDVSVLHDLDARRDHFRQIADVLMEDRVILPLFESSLLYSFSPDIFWDIRLDGQILASEIFGNVVK
ncbi:hypothetical protein HOD30_02125 [Candidatus Peregrinibacteria bacterium]|nr:hypothetical protein [Candidatus Peregrinibacteria bacterium]MBT4631590.1 hypothetical protein [Candidatus Peregrinibacteria bacterium]MBT5517138.1 hypothetical protein [Candidatus Peregrinibacteria bacterium]MBT5824113.1 hypothetical protein [Candidatus Peregrinibacteria bacterium]